MKRVCAEEFCRSWDAFSVDFMNGNPDWQALYNSNSLWTQRFLGGRRSSSENSPFGNFMRSQFEGLRYRMEDGSFDLAFSFETNYRGLPYLSRGEVHVFDLENSFYPTSYDIIVEVENSSVCSWQEMTKLTWVRCPLKVLITYENKPNDRQMLTQCMSAIITQSNERFAEDALTEYLLIIGNCGNDTLNWTYYIFGTNGHSRPYSL